MKIYSHFYIFVFKLERIFRKRGRAYKAELCNIKKKDRDFNIGGLKIWMVILSMVVQESG